MKKIAVIAVGGNALASEGDGTSIMDQAAAAARTAQYVIDVAAAGWQVVLTHGNGPQVGYILRRSEIAANEVPVVPMDYATADTQGAIGVMFQRSFLNELRRRGLKNPVATVVTQVEVDPDDGAFANPTKPIGSIMKREIAEDLAAKNGWSLMEEAGRGWRRCVASPQPKRVVETGTVSNLLDSGHIVIACGGGGIPVVSDNDGNLSGREAVIDKDLASSLLARELRAERLLIATAVPQVAINFGKPDVQWLSRLTLSEAGRFMDEGHFGKGSMGPKVAAVMDYVAACDGEGVITDIEHMGLAIEGKAGTRIVRG